MSDKISRVEDDTDEMLPEYNFSGGVRGKHARAFQLGYKVIIHKVDGTTEEQDYGVWDEDGKVKA